MAFVAKSCLLFPMFLFITLCTRTQKMEYWTHLLGGNPPACSHCLLHADSIAPNLSSALAFRFSHQPRPALKQGSKKSCPHAEPGLEEERKAQQKLLGSSRAGTLPPNPTSQTRQILSLGIIYFGLRHAQGRLKWWVNRFLRMQF